MDARAPSLLCGVLADVPASLGLLAELAGARLPLRDLLHLVHPDACPDVSILEAAGLHVLGEHGGATVRGFIDADPPAPGMRPSRHALQPLDRMARHNPETYWTLIDGHVHENRVVVVLVTRPNDSLDDGTFALFLAHAVHRVQLVDVAPD